MQLTPEQKRDIDSRSYESLLRHWRFAAAGHPVFQGETGKYWLDRMQAMKMKDPAGAVAASKRIGWDRP
jgi:hypothetical protein